MVRFATALALALAAAPGGASAETPSSSASLAGGTTVPGTTVPGSVSVTTVPGTAPVTASTASGVRSSGEPAVQDDYPQALAQARRRGLPLLVEVWAPW